MTAAPQADLRRWPTLDDWIQSYAAADRRRLPTGLPTLDDHFRGGVPVGKTVVLAGAPGACKTTVLTQWAVEWARQGKLVMIVAVDEEPGDLVCRIGQMLGFAREDIETRNPWTIQALRSRCGTELPTLHMSDGAEVDVDAASERLAEIAEQSEAPRVLVLDSVQTAITADGLDADGVRARIDACMEALRRARRRGQTVIATSEVARGYYASRDASVRTHPLAAAKESGRIEYAAHALIAMTTVEDVVGCVDAVIAKCRFGRRTQTPIRFRQDFDRCTVSETERPPEPTREAKQDLAIGRAKDRVLKVLAKYNDLRSRNAVCELTGGTKAHILAAIEALLDAGAIEIAPDKTFRLASGSGDEG